jgi:hypothetical protein
MDRNKKLPGCGHCGISRRGFLLSGGAAAAGLLAAPGTMASEKSGGKMRIRVVYALHAIKQPKPDWPNLGFDFAPVIERINNTLANAFPEIEFLHSSANGPAQAGNIVFKDAFSRIDGYIVVQLNTANLVAPSFAASGKPVLFTRFQYAGTGGFLIFNAMALKEKSRNMGFVASSNTDDLVAAVKCFEQVKKGGSRQSFAEATAQVRKQRTPGPGDLNCLPDPVETVSPEECLRQARASKILAVGYPGVSLIGVPVIPMKTISFEELDSAWKTADRDESRAVAEGWRKNAALVEGVSAETLDSSAAMYLGMKSLLKKHGANAVTVNCLTGVYGGRLQAYPCMGFHQFCNDGLVGACECDVKSAATMILGAALTKGRPGYISDPEIDTSKRQIIYAHCVASNRVFGPKGPANPFQILTHSEDRKGASVRSLMPAGYMTTTLEFDPVLRQVLIHQAKTLGNDPDDRACRTKLVAEPVGDIEKLFTEWFPWGWHRVTFYGDLKEPVAALADAMGYKMVAEA